MLCTCGKYIYVEVHMLWHVCRGYICYGMYVKVRGQLMGVCYPPYIMWVPGLKLRSSVLMAGASTHWTLSLCHTLKSVLSNITCL